MRRFGFTIVELLVVLAIVALITGLFIPALCATRLQARATICSSNIKQILNLLAVYEQQNGIFPYGFDDSIILSAVSTKNCPGNPSRDKMGKWWFQYLGYIYMPDTKAENDSVFWCPSRCVKDLAPDGIFYAVIMGLTARYAKMLLNNLEQWEVSMWAFLLTRPRFHTRKVYCW